jgi:hypothetical protein
MPTSSTDRRALPSVRKAGRRPANSDMASLISMPLALDSR